MLILGLALIIGSGVKLSISSPFPGVNALCSVVGASFIVRPGSFDHDCCRSFTRAIEID